MTVENIALISGPPGSGKSSVASRLSRQTCLGHMSTGDHIRAISTGLIKSRYMDAIVSENKVLSRSGRLPNDLVCAIIQEEFETPEARRNVLLDGYPRSAEQIEPLFNTFIDMGARAVALVHLEIDRDEAIRRMVGRGGRMGERRIGVDFAGERYDAYAESYKDVLTILANDIPMQKVQASASLDVNTSLVRNYLQNFLDI